MCTVDWAALGTWVGAGVVLLGVIVAWVQLRSLRANEVIRTTIEYMRAYTVPAAIVFDDPAVTPALASNTVGQIVSSAASVAKYRAEAQASKDGSLFREYGSDGEGRFKRKSYNVLVIANYFLIAESLIRRKRLDKALFLETYSKQIMQVWMFAGCFQDVDQNAKDIFRHLRYKGFAESTRMWLRQERPKFVSRNSAEGASPNPQIDLKIDSSDPGN